MTIDDYFQEICSQVKGLIEIDPNIYGGAPCVAGTRVPVYALLTMVEEGCSFKKILKAYPSLGQAELSAALRFAVLVMER